MSYNHLRPEERYIDNAFNFICQFNLFRLVFMPFLGETLGLFIPIAYLQRLQMSYNHLRPEERYYIDIELKKGTSQNKMAKSDAHFGIPTCPVIILPYPANALKEAVTFLLIAIYL
jgi:hypothetical protein